jgi:hypothetical protein
LGFLRVWVVFESFANEWAEEDLNFISQYQFVTQLPDGTNAGMNPGQELSRVQHQMKLVSSAEADNSQGSPATSQVQRVTHGRRHRSTQDTARAGKRKPTVKRKNANSVINSRERTERAGGTAIPMTSTIVFVVSVS